MCRETCTTLTNNSAFLNPFQDILLGKIRKLCRCIFHRFVQTVILNDDRITHGAYCGQTFFDSLYGS